MKDTRPKEFVYQIMNIGRRIETTISQLVERFSIQNIIVKDLWHLMSKTYRKILAHTIAFVIAKSCNFEHILD